MGAVVVQIADQRIEVHLQNGLMDLLLQTLGDAVKAKDAGALDEHDLIMQLAEGIATQEIVRRGEEEG